MPKLAQYTTYSENSAYVLTPQGKGFTTPLMSDITVSDTRITFEQVFQNKPNDLTKKTKGLTPKDIEYMKTYTLAQAAFAYNADIIVYPLISVNTSEDGKTITVKLTGYPGYYSNFRKATEEDMKLIRATEEELYLQKFTDNGGNLLPYIMHKDCCDHEGCPEGKHHKKMSTPVNMKDVKVTIENVEK